MEVRKGNDVLDIVKELITITYEDRMTIDYAANSNGDIKGYMINKKVIQYQLYLAQSIALHYWNMRLFREPIEAWKNGPVVASVYGMLTHQVGELDIYRHLSNRKVNALEQYLLEMVYSLTKAMTLDQLESMVKEEGCAWDKHYRKREIEPRKIIPQEDLKEMFSLHKDFFKKASVHFANYKSPYYDKDYEVDSTILDSLESKEAINQYDSEGRKTGYWEELGLYLKKGYYVEGRKTGYWVIESDDFRIKCPVVLKGHFVDGLKEGLWETMYENGLRKEEHFSKGKLNGLYSFFNEDGDLFEEGVYKDDARIGLWKFKDDETGEWKTEVYLN